MVTQSARGGTERNKKRRGRHRQRRQRDQHGRQQQRRKDRYACYYCLSMFLHFRLFFVSLFFFSDYFLSNKYNNRQGTKGKRQTAGAGHTRAAIATWDGTEGADRANEYVFFYVFVLSALLFYSYHSSSFPIISFSVKYNNKRAGRGRQTRAAMATPGGTGRDRARQIRLLFSVTVFFLLSSFLLLTFIISFVANCRTGQDGMAPG